VKQPASSGRPGPGDRITADGARSISAAAGSASDFTTSVV
jgi:hypothetical protein